MNIPTNFARKYFVRNYKYKICMELLGYVSKLSGNGDIIYLRKLCIEIDHRVTV
jgi:hypothetical protein